MNQYVMSFAAFAGLLLAPVASQATPVEYVKVCSIYGASFHYIPGTDICLNEATGDARQQTEGGTWRSLLPYPEGRWVGSPLDDCAHGRIVRVGTFTSTDFVPNAWNRKQTNPVAVNLRKNEFVAKVIMSGGFSDPRLPNRHGANSTDGLCVRSVDPGVNETTGDGSYNPPFGNGMLPIGCIANSRIVGMPAAYSIDATSTYPSIDSFYLDGGQNAVSGPYTYGSKLVVTTDFGNTSQQQLTYYDARLGSNQPLAGSVSVSVCVLPGSR
jgi:hypothetical protein